MHFKYRMKAYRASWALGARAGTVTVIVHCCPAGTVLLGEQRSTRAPKRLPDSALAGTIEDRPTLSSSAETGTAL